jgi:ECF sigma factor
MSDVTRILAQIDAGDPAAAEQLLPLAYDELRKLAAAKLAHKKPGQALQATALVHEAYLRLVGGGARDSGLRTRDAIDPASALAPSPQPLCPAFNSRGHFFAAAAEAMWRIPVEPALARLATKQTAHFLPQANRELELPSGGFLLSPVYMTFGQTDPSTLAYEE